MKTFHILKLTATLLSCITALIQTKKLKTTNNKITQKFNVIRISVRMGNRICNVLIKDMKPTRKEKIRSLIYGLGFTLVIVLYCVSK